MSQMNPDEAYDEERQREVDMALPELEFLNYCNAVEAGDTEVEIIAFFGAVRARELKEQYAREMAERKAAPFERAIADPNQREWVEPTNVTCQSCGVKFCFGKCRAEAARESRDMNRGYR